MIRRPATTPEEKQRKTEAFCTGCDEMRSNTFAEL